MALWRATLTYRHIHGFEPPRIAVVVLPAPTKEKAKKAAEVIARTFWKRRLDQEGGDTFATVEPYGSDFVLVKGAE